MKTLHTSLRVGIIVLAAAVLALPAFSAPEWMTRVGTIAEALSQPDGSAVYLDAVEVERIAANSSPSYFVIREMWKIDSRIVVYTAPPATLRQGQQLDIEGVVGTLPNGERAILNPRIVGYLDSAGNLLALTSVRKGITSPTPWQWKAEVASPGAASPLEATTPGEPSAAPSEGPAFFTSIASMIAGSAEGATVKLQCKKIVGSGVDPDYGAYVILGDDGASSTLKVYCSSLDGIAGVAGMDAAADDQPARVNEISGQVRAEGGNTVLAVDGGPGFDPQGYVGGVEPIASGSPAFARTLADGTSVTVSPVVLTEFDPSGHVAYVQDLDRCGGIRVSCDGPENAVRGAIVSVTGSLKTAPQGEREIVAGAQGITVVASPGSMPRPVGLTNRNVGGADFNELTPGINYPTKATGLYNKGLLVRIWGRVTAVDAAANAFYLADGSRDLDYYVDEGGSLRIRNSFPVNVKVVWSADGPVSSLPSVGDFLTDVVGISSSEAREPGQYARVVIVRKIAAPVISAAALSGLVDLTWTTQDYTFYRLYRSTSESGRFSQIASVDGGSYRDLSVINGTTYYYKVTGYTSGIEGGASPTASATPVGGVPTVTSTFDSATFTYTYTVTCPANNEFGFAYLQVDAQVPNAAPTGPWFAQGALVGGLNQNWPFISIVPNPTLGYGSAVWDALATGLAVPANAPALAQFTLVAPATVPATGSAVTKGLQAQGSAIHQVLVPGPLPSSPPTTTIGLDGQLGDNDWFKTAVQVSLSAIDPEDDFSRSSYKLDEEAAEWQDFTETVEVSDDGEHAVWARSEDNAGNVEDPPVSSAFKIDATPPAITGQPTTQPNANGWYNSDVQINWSFVDATSGLVSPQAADPGVSVASTALVSAEGAAVAGSADAKDVAGNTASKTVELKIDKTPPALSVVSAPAGSDYVISYDTATTVFTATDAASGLDGMPWATVDISPTEGWASASSTTYTATSTGDGKYQISFPFTVPGAYTIRLFAKDKAGNTGQLAVPLTFGAAGFTVEWLPPISTMDIYAMQDGSTLPVKFRLIDPRNQSAWINTYLYTVKVMDTANKVWKQVTCPQPDVANSGYQANISTKDANGVAWPVGDYTVVIEGPGIWDAVSGPYRSRYGLDIVDTSVAKGKGKR